MSYSEAEITDFLRHRVPVLLARLAPDQAPAWGLMTAQHMLEHLIGSLRLSVGRYDFAPPVPSPGLDQAWAWLASDRPLSREVRNHALPPTPPPLRLPSLAAAAAELLLSLDEFFAHFAHHPTAAPVHMLLGSLTFEQWRLFHFKHFGHHFLQFGLLPRSLLPRSFPSSNA